MGYWSNGLIRLPINPSLQHSSTPFSVPPSSPRFNRDLFPSFRADDFQRIDARQYFIRDRQPFGKRLAYRFSAVKAGFGRYIALGRARIERRSVHSRQQYQAAIGLETSGQRQQHFALIEDVHVFVEYEGMFDV